MSTKVYTEPVRSCDWLKHEQDREFSREQGIIKGPHGILPSGTVLGRAADGRYSPFDGTDAVRAILLDPVTDNSADSRCVVIVADSIITKHYLGWDGAVNDAAKAAALTALEAFNIKVRGDA